MLRKILAITVLTALLMVTTDNSGFGAEHRARRTMEVEG